MGLNGKGKVQIKKLKAEIGKERAARPGGTG
jgi:hypothetical protein